jgi:hypothetical protein
MEYKFLRHQLYKGFETPEERVFFAFLSKTRGYKEKGTLFEVPAVSLKDPILYGKDTQTAIVDIIQNNFTQIADVDWAVEKKHDDDIALYNKKPVGELMDGTKTAVTVVWRNDSACIFDYKNELSDTPSDTYGYKYPLLLPDKVKRYMAKMDIEMVYRLKHSGDKLSMEKKNFYDELRVIQKSFKTKHELLTKYGSSIQPFVPVKKQ